MRVLAFVFKLNSLVTVGERTTLPSESFEETRKHAVVSFQLRSMALGCLLTGTLFAVPGKCFAGEFITRANSAVRDISSDGSIVLWEITTEDSTIVQIDGQDAWEIPAFARGVDDVGQRVAGWENVWERQEDESAGSIDTFDGSALDLSADGQIAAGTGPGTHNPQSAFTWQETQGVATLTPIPGFPNSEAWGISGDGQVIAGASEPSNLGTMSEATIWKSNNAGDFVARSLGRPSGESSWARFLSADGSVVVGGVGDSTGGGHVGLPVSLGHESAFRWTEEAGMVELDLLQGTLTNTPTGVSGDGSVIVGNSETSNVVTPMFIWDTDHGMRDLKKVLIEEHGLSAQIFPSDVTSVQVLAISSDATAVGGRYRVGDARTGWLTLLDRPLGSPAVPEPSTSVLLCAAAALLGWHERRTCRARQVS